MKLLLLINCLIFTACSPGILYTDIKEPLFTNITNARVGDFNAIGKSYEIKEPFSPIGGRIEIASKAPGDIAKNSNLTKISYADIRTQSYLLGIWKKQTVYVYGE